MERLLRIALVVAVLCVMGFPYETVSADCCSDRGGPDGCRHNRIACKDGTVSDCMCTPEVSSGGEATPHDADRRVVVIRERPDRTDSNPAWARHDEAMRRKLKRDMIREYQYLHPQH